jgi:tRNA (cmo5U34)-methyltransferase
MLPGADLRIGRLQDALPDGRFDTVVSALAVHHLPATHKADLFRRIAATLRLSGRFVLGDVVVPEYPNEAVTALEPGVDLPDTLADQLQWLSDAGLSPHVTWSADDLVVVAADKLA